MMSRKLFLTLALSAFIPCACAAFAQSARPTATRPLQLSAFGGFSGDFTGLEGGKNLSLTAGGDLAFPPYRGIRPTFEVRGRFPIDHGLVDSQKDILGGGVVEFRLNSRLRPYGDFFFGRGSMHYGLTGYIYKNFIYSLTTTYVDSFGGGFNYNISDNVAIKVDAQVEHWGSAPNSKGRIYSSVATAGAVYYFSFDRHHHRY